MDTASDPATQFAADITRLIAEIEACIQLQGGLGEREARLQRLVFQERRRQAEGLAARLSAGTAQWLHLDGDARRILDSLALSLDYFRQRAMAATETVSGGQSPFGDSPLKQAP